MSGISRGPCTPRCSRVLGFDEGLLRHASHRSPHLGRHWCGALWQPGPHYLASFARFQVPHNRFWRDQGVWMAKSTHLGDVCPITARSVNADVELEMGDCALLHARGAFRPGHRISVVRAIKTVGNFVGIRGSRQHKSAVIAAMPNRLSHPLWH